MPGLRSDGTESCFCFCFRRLQCPTRLRVWLKGLTAERVPLGQECFFRREQEFSDAHAMLIANLQMP